MYRRRNQAALVPNPTRTRAIIFSPDWRLMVTESNSHAGPGVQLRDARTGAGFYEWNEEIKTSVFSPDRILLAILYQDNNIRILDIGTGTECWLGKMSPSLRSRYSIFFTPMCFSADGKSLAIPWEIGGEHVLGVVLWDVEKGTMLKFLRNSNYPITAFSFTLDGKVIIAAYQGGFSVWHLQSGANLWNVEARRERLGATGTIAFSPNSWFFAIYSIEPDTIHLWDMESRTTVQSISSRSKFLCFSPDRAMFGSLSTDYSLIIWDINAGVVFQKHIFYTPLRQLTFSSCGNYLKTKMSSFPALAHVVD